MADLSGLTLPRMHCHSPDAPQVFKKFKARSQLLADLVWRRWYLLTGPGMGVYIRRGLSSTALQKAIFVFPDSTYVQ